VKARQLLSVFLLGAALVCAARGEALKRSSLRLVDDRRQPIASSLEACFQVGTRSDCTSLPAGGWVELPADWTGVRIEGPEHGPISAKPGDLKPGPDGLPFLRIPRKAELQVAAAAKERITVSLYPRDDPTFRSPSFRREVRGGESIKIPAGDHLVSLLAPGRAPDLHLLSAPPASRQAVSYSPRSGWSFVARALSAKERTPVSGARLRLRASEGFGAPRAQGGFEMLTGKAGVAVVSGISYPLAGAAVEHPSFIRGHQEGISATPGTFAFREIRLEEGGTLRATVTTDGRPARGVTCQVLEYEANPIGPAREPAVHSASVTSASGVCLSSKVAEGPYTLRLRVQGKRTFVDRSVTVVNGQETAVNVPLSTIRVSGTVLKGDKPASSYVVSFLDKNELKPNGTRRDAQAEAATDADGKYETVLWSSGDYFARLDTPEGTPADSKRVSLENREEQVDFHLEDQDVRGVVLDDRDRPIPDARVLLKLSGLSRMAKTDEKGAFLFPLPDTGVCQVEAVKQGYLNRATAEVVINPNTPVAPLVLHLKRAGVLSGRIFSGGPAAGASLLGYRVQPGGLAAYVGETLADAEGRFELPAAEGGTTRVFATGGGCPLASFDVQPSAEDLSLHCPEVPASLALQFEDKQGRPMAGRSVFARKDGVIIPNEVLSRHLGRFNLPAAADGGGRLFLVGLAPGSYDFFLVEATFPELVAQGSQQGFLTAATLSPFSTTELQVTLDPGP
jgi:Carboxypeptidase regulatory-like domain